MNILHEADRLTSQDRNEAYGHPADDFEKQAGAFNAIFADYLSKPFTPEMMPMIQIIVKLSRWSHGWKLDHPIDIAGYSRTAQMCKEERERRASLRKDILRLHDLRVSATSTTMTPADVVHATAER